MAANLSTARLLRGGRSVAHTVAVVGVVATFALAGLLVRLPGVSRVV